MAVRSVCMKISGDNSFLEFDRTGSDQLGTYCSIEGCCENFNGKIEGVYFLYQDSKGFIKQFEALEKSRNGSAELLNASSPSEANPFKFSVFSTDDIGHVAIKTTLQKWHYLRNSADNLS